MQVKGLCVRVRVYGGFDWYDSLAQKAPRSTQAVATHELEDEFVSVLATFPSADEC